MSKHWLILEVETGMMDGYYSTEELGVKALDTWKDRRPEYRHMLCNVTEGVTDFGPERFLPNAYFQTMPEADERDIPPMSANEAKDMYPRFRIRVRLWLIWAALSNRFTYSSLTGGAWKWDGRKRS